MVRHLVWTWLVSGLSVVMMSCTIAPGPGTPQSGCAADDPRVGQTGTFTNNLHGISGTARIVDNCTIVIEHFWYDGIGLDVRVVGDTDFAFKDGVRLTDNLVRLGGYKDATLTIHLPEGVTLDDVRTLSINCIAVDGNFGDAYFH